MTFHWLAAAKDILFPPQCVACDAPGRCPFCRVCEEALLKPETGLGLPFEVLSALQYGGPVEVALARLKRDQPVLGPSLGTLLVPLATKIDWDLAVPVPSSKSRLQRRGHSPPRELARALPGPVSPFSLRRRQDRPPQTGLARADRLVNQRGAFEAHPHVQGRKILLVDDVVTTGATLQAAASAVLKAGARSVGAVTLARTE